MKELLLKEDISFLRSFIYRFKELAKISRKISKIDENDCNGYKDLNGNWDNKAEQRADKKRTKLLKKAEELAKGIGLKIYHQSDPRGLSLYLVTEEEFLKGSNCNYTEGISVY